MDSEEETGDSNHPLPFKVADSSNNNVVYMSNYARRHRHSVGAGCPGHRHAGRANRRRSSVAFRAALVVEQAARRMSVPSFSIDRLEEDLSREIEAEEKQKRSTNIIQILRRSCKEILHSKKILLLVVILNIFDCALVLPGLILDIHYIKEMVKDAKLLTRKFTSSMTHVYPACFLRYDTFQLHEYYNTILSGMKNCNHSESRISNKSYGVIYDVIYSDFHHNHGEGLGFTVEDLPAFLTKHHNGHQIEIKLGVIFHKASIAILAVLVLIVILKVVSYGKDILRRRLELFDGMVVIASFILDIVYLKGFTIYPIEDIVQILAFLLPWRVIRVSNSLVMAVMDQAHLQLKMVYNEKKKYEEKLNDSEVENMYHQKIIGALKKLCIAEGISSSKIDSCISACGPMIKKKRKSKRSFKKKLKKATCLSLEGDRKSLPYGHGETLQQETLSHLRRIASGANHMSTFEEVEEEKEDGFEEEERDEGWRPEDVKFV
ncbi:hypothetical protein FSP39_021153 [Pinctada imbricata]|uniref:Voltage-gated hydrogen channel 1 n=1 Tax=Pinctada imbricata TaxID=66713 RepID=A0AA88YEY8_PINIB|nr:hypothetical protein FSP39_021153 [Pinctada imbricata]